MLRKLFNISAFAAITAASLSVWVPTASSRSLEQGKGQAQYLPFEAVTYEFGSKYLSGYFVARASRCFVTLMVIEKSDPDHLLPLTAARVRLILYPGQIAGLDSEEGRSLNVTCANNASRLLVDVGGREELVALQNSAAITEVAEFIVPDSE
jgi:hypothetical protein